MVSVSAFKESYAKFFMGVLQSVLDHEASNIGTILKSMSKCKATNSVLIQAYKQLSTIREMTPDKNHQYLGKAFFYGLSVVDTQGDTFSVRLDAGKKTIFVKLPKEERFNEELKAKTWLGNQFRQTYYFLLAKFDPIDEQPADDLIEDVKRKITAALQVEVGGGEPKESRKRLRPEPVEESEIDNDDTISLVSENLRLQTPQKKRNKL